MKILSNDMYLLLIDEEAEIKPKNKVWWEDPEDGLTSQLNTVIEVYEELIFMSEPYASEIEALPQEVSLVIAYYPLTEEAEELDLPKLPNPFEEVDIEKLAKEHGSLYINQREKELGYLSFCEGYKVAQSKQFSLEDVEKAIEMARSGSNGLISFKDFVKPDYTQEEIIQSLSTQQLPKEFIPEYEDYEVIGERDDDGYPLWSKKLKTITNSEGKEELVGTYKY